MESIVPCNLDGATTQYSNRYRSFDERIQEAFNEALEILKKSLTTRHHLEKFLKLWKLLNQVTNRFMTSYEENT